MTIRCIYLDLDPELVQTLTPEAMLISVAKFTANQLIKLTTRYLNNIFVSNFKHWYHHSD